MNRTILAWAAACAIGAFGPSSMARELRLEDARAVYPAYRTWEFEVDEPGLYAIDIVPPDIKTRPAVREWIDGVQIAFARGGRDYSDKADESGRLRRFRWLDAGTHALDLYLHFHAYHWTDEMEKAMVEKGIRVTLTRLGPRPAAEGSDSRPAARASGEAAALADPAGFWMPDDCMARIAGVPLVVCGAAGGEARPYTMEVWPAAGDTRQAEPGVPNVELSAGVSHVACRASGAAARSESAPYQGGAAPLWSQTLAVGGTPVRFEYPCPEEGSFVFVVRDEKGEVVEGPWNFAVTDVRQAPRATRQAEPGVSDAACPVSDLGGGAAAPIPIDRVLCTEGAGGEHLFREGGKSEIVETPDGAYRLAGPQGCRNVWRRQNPDGTWSPANEGEKGALRKSFHDWFGYTLKVAHPGKSHALVVRVPNDVRHFTSVVAYDRRTALSSAWSIDSGDAPAAGPWSEMKIPVWPNSGAIDVMVLSTDGAGNTHIPHPNRRGAVAELSLLEYPEGFPAVEAPACGWNATREFGWDGEQVNLGPNERTMPPLPDAAAALVWNPPAGSRGPYHDWNDLLTTWDRAFELEAWRGGTTLMYPVYTYSMVTFQGRAQMIVPAGRDVYANECFGGGAERNPFDRDVFALMLQRAEKHGVKVVADFMIQLCTEEVVKSWFRLCGMEGETVGVLLSKTADGVCFRTRSAHKGMLNPAHPVARSIQVEFCREFGRRYGRYKSFAGINHRFWKGWPGCFDPWFYDADTGFDDFTVGEFSKATGIALAPVGTNETAFAARKKLIREDYGREWDAWRAEVCRSLHAEMLAALHESAPQARFFAGAWMNSLSNGSGLAPSVFDGIREFGFDGNQKRIRGPGVEINKLDPIHFGNFWVHEPGGESPNGAAPVLPPPTGLCCNSSYRCSPYHLEPAALALADNRLDQLWAGGQWCLPPLDDALRAFVRAYRAIPDRRDWRQAPIERASTIDGNRPQSTAIDGGGSAAEHAPVAVWWARDGDDVLLWAVNRTDTTRRVVLRFDKDPDALADCVSGGRAAAISLPPFMPGVFRAKGAGALLGFEVPVEPDEAAQIERDYAFFASLGAMPGCETAVEISQGTGETYLSGGGALAKRDERWTWRDLFGPMEQAHEAGDLLELRRLLADFRARHRWWFEEFGWPEDLCVTRNVARKTLAGFLDYQRKVKPEELSFRETDGLETALLPQSKQRFVVAAQGAPVEIGIHNPPGGLRQLEVNALFGGGYGDIRVEDWDGNLLGVIPGGGHRGPSNAIEADCNRLQSTAIDNPRLETRLLPAPIPCANHDVRLRFIGTGDKGLAIQSAGIRRLPPRPVREWLVIGPFDKGGGERDAASYDKSFPPETEPFDSDAGYEGMGGGTVRWKTVTLGEGERVVDVLAAAPHEISKMNGVAYLRTVVTAKRRQPVMLHYANDWYGTIFLNGEPLVPKMRGPTGQYRGIEVWLRRGENEILVKTSPGSAGRWFFGLAIDDDGTLDFK